MCCRRCRRGPAIRNLDVFHDHEGFTTVWSSKSFAIMKIRSGVRIAAADRGSRAGYARPGTADPPRRRVRTPVITSASTSRRAQPGSRSRGNTPDQMTCCDQDQIGHNGSGERVTCHGKGERVAGLPHEPHGRPVACPRFPEQQCPNQPSHRTTLPPPEKFKNSFIPPPIRSGPDSEGAI